MYFGVPVRPTSYMYGDNNRILAPETHQLGGLEGGDKPLLVVDAQLGDLNQTTTQNTLDKAQNTQQSTKVWLQ